MIQRQDELSVLSRFDHDTTIIIITRANNINAEAFSFMKRYKLLKKSSDIYHDRFEGIYAQ